MNINYIETLILSFLLKNQNNPVNEYHIFNDIKKYKISSSDMVIELLELKRKNFVDEDEEENKKIILTPRGHEYARNIIKIRLEFLKQILDKVEIKEPTPNNVIEISNEN